MSEAVLVLVGLLAYVAVQIAVQIAAGRDLGKRKRVRGGNRWLWVIIILLLLPGALAYFAFGRLPDEETSTLPPQSPPAW
ncbi:MAG: hypothetical protein F4X20_03990 [Dehalococcoidia bacterium]|nr:hypothetical protein [Dehalococcoidia bacterium]